MEHGIPAYMSNKDLKGVISNFIGTYKSRHSDYRGYWLFGLLVENLEKLTINLVDPEATASEATPVEAAVKLAQQKFREQLQKGGIAISEVSDAILTIEKLTPSITGLVNHRKSSGHTVKLSVQVTLTTGRNHVSESSLFVAIHNPQIEFQRRDVVD